MDALLVRPLINVEKNSPIFLPLGLLYLAASVRAVGGTVGLIDYEFLVRRDRWRVGASTYLRDMAGPILQRQPKVVGITAMADTLPMALLLGRYLKSAAPSLKIVLGGQGLFGTVPEVLRKYPDCVDYACKAEGDVVFGSLVAAIASGDPHPVIAGTWSLYDGAVTDNGNAPLVSMDSLPAPAYDLVPVEDYLEIASPSIFDVYLGSGCTYRCRFCSTAPYWGNVFRAKSPEVTLRELDALNARYGVTQFNFLHDNFANLRGYTDEFLDYFARYNTRYEWGCSLRLDNISSAQLARLQAAGCFRVFTGTDSGSAKILRQMAKLPSSAPTYRFFDACRDAGLTFETNTIIGYPDEGPDDLEESIALTFDSVAYGGEAPDVSILQPLPGVAVTAAHLDRLEFIEEQQFGAFVPPEVVQMARDEPVLFSGFYFIRKNNRDFAYYLSVVKLVRYFTRHYLHTVFFLKRICGSRYIDLFEALHREQPLRYRERLGQFIEALGEHPWRTLLEDLLAYDDAMEELRGTDVLEEIENVYSEAAQRPDTNHRRLSLRHPVDRVIATMPDLHVPAGMDAATEYLLYRDDRRRLVALRLAEWQTSLWDAMALRARAGKPPASPRTSRASVEEIVASSNFPRARVVAAVRDAAHLFGAILGPMPSEAYGEHEMRRRYFGRTSVVPREGASLDMVGGVLLE